MSKVPKSSKPGYRTLHSRAGTVFSVARVRRQLKAFDPNRKLGVGAAVYLASVLEYLSAEVLELSGKACLDNNRRTITPRHITLAIYNDDELKKLWEHVIIAQGGVLPHIESTLLPKPSKKTAKTQENVQSQEY